MNFLSMTKARYSVRKFSADPVEPERLDRILEAARNAPTAHNNQPQRIFVMQSPEALAIVDACTRGRFGAPVVLILCYDANESWKRKDGYDSGEVDLGIIGTHIMFEAVEQGLGTCWIAMFKPEEVRLRLSLPDHINPIAMMPIGHPAPDAEPYQFHDQRRLLADTVIRK
ncbi:MAG TPA: nitroreductase [Acholeplasmatales bacterium]|nr:nitroreductase [Acholeplasmatales bacterium]